MNLHKHLLVLQYLMEKIDANKATQSEIKAFDSILELIEHIHELEKSLRTDPSLSN
jgi:hypothetical protein